MQALTKRAKVLEQTPLTVWERLYLPAILKGMAITFGHIFRKKATINYPEEKRPFSPVFRGLHILNRDEEVDAFYTSLFRELITYMIEDPRRTQVCIDLMFCAKSLERIGDHSTNIAEKIHYMIHGEQINRQRSTGKAED